ncbi:PilN domain-containing protein [Waterburya agarophytonicola K14]|uniref:PilN domain-containing protein n=1 Tax=Waterburya agarophytonicola KI4 TaxID=2874699 RepID=A0A964FHC7_9CYAN|nr:PilN domain-containing protein [Waterburya agarophytonicola]MCC0177373.1 PilN domain-containing protein [Waterburya agarophytonicola KI4]
MYNLDINFLRDRGLAQSTEVSDSFVQKKEPSIVDKIPIAVGVLVALIASISTFVHLQGVNAKTTGVEEDIKRIESEIADLGNQNKKIEAANEEIQKIEQETSALIGVFEKIKPWAAIMQEVSDRTPPGVQVDSIEQSGSGSATGINLSGTARSYSDVNDFILFLQRSPFFDAKKIQLNTAGTADFQVEIENEDILPENASFEVPQGIKYKISTQLKNVPTSKLIEEINKKGSTGLVTRLKILEQKGAILK